MGLGDGRYTTHLDLDLALQAEPVAALLEAFVAEEVHKIGMKRVVVGLSGGLDSSLACAIAVRALGPTNVLGVVMPYTTSRPESRLDAELLADQLNIHTVLKPIAAQVDTYFETEPDAGRVRRGNKMARERMTILYDLSAKWKALVLGTSNKTELLLGYSTLWGDSASALNPNGDLYKTQAFQMGAHYRLPESILGKAPS
ncbi:MAG TPA: NAD(+) synthase, partial [bacterium]|nr:NAD(+) synthase [bacterium]